MDEIEGGILSSVPPAALTLNLTRAADQDGALADLADRQVEPGGRPHYLPWRVAGIIWWTVKPRVMEPGDAMLIFAGQRFIGWNEQDRRPILAVAQHFTLDIYGRHNLVEQMDLKPKLSLSRWPLLEPLVRHYRQSAPPSSVTLGQHHLFMVLLIAFIDDAFLGMRRPSQFPAGRCGSPGSGCHESDHDDFRQSARP